MGLHQLPIELLLDIAGGLTRFDLDQLARTSKYLRGLILPVLHRDACLLSLDGVVVHEKDVNSIGAGNQLRHARSLTLASPDPVRTLEVTRAAGKCRSSDLLGAAEDCKDAVRVVGRLGDCEPGKLKKFSWLLGKCVPDEILGPGGLLSRTQGSLEELKLVTGYDGGGIHPSTTAMDLSPFTNLTSLTWIGIRPSQHPTLSEALLQTCPQLLHLELNFLTNSTDGLPWAGPPLYGAEPFLHSFIMSRLRQDPGTRLFPRLRSLSLTNAVLHDLFRKREPDIRLPHSLNVRRLEKLRLCWCAGWQTLFTRREPGDSFHENSPDSDSDSGDESTGPKLALRSLELQVYCPVSYLVKGQVGTLTSTLRRSPDLESLVVYVRARGGAAYASGRTWVTLFGDLRRLERLRLRALVFHVDLPDPRRVAAWADAGGLVACPLMDIVFGQPRGHVDGVLPEFLSYGNIPSDLVADDPAMRASWIRSNVYNRRGAGLIGLHVRQGFLAHRYFYNRATGYTLRDHDHEPGRPVSMRKMLTSSCYEYVTRLFKSARFPHLRFVAFGDFSALEPRGRLLLCRTDGGVDGDGRSLQRVVGEAEEPMRLVDESDGEIIELLDRYMHLLVVGPPARWWRTRVGAPLHGSSSWQPGLAARLARENGRRAASVVERDRSTEELDEFTDYEVSDWDGGE